MDHRSRGVNARVSAVLDVAAAAAAGAAAGAGLVYLLDPASGARRRGRLSARAFRISREAARAVRRLSGDFAGRGHGLLPRLRNLVRRAPPDDEILRERVRSKSGHYLSRPRALGVETRAGVVTLHGSLPPSESERLAYHVRWLPGVRAVRNRATRPPSETPPRPDHPSARRPEHSSASGPERPSAKRKGLHSRRWPPALRFMSVALGTALVLSGQTRRGVWGAGLAAAGFAFAWRGVRNRPLRWRFLRWN